LDVCRLEVRLWVNPINESTIVDYDAYFLGELVLGRFRETQTGNADVTRYTLDT